MATLVLVGATGYVGSHILKEAVKRGHKVIAVARHIDKLKSDDNVKPVVGSITDRNAILELTQRADVLINAVSPRPASESHKLLDSLPVMVEAAQKNKVRLGIVGGAGSLLIKEGGDQVMSTMEGQVPPDLMVEVRTQSELLRQLQSTPPDVDWFYLSPPPEFGSHVPGTKKGQYRVGADIMVTDSEGKSAISGEDYAMAFLDEIENPKHHRRRFTVAY